MKMSTSARPFAKLSHIMSPSNGMVGWTATLACACRKVDPGLQHRLLRISADDADSLHQIVNMEWVKCIVICARAWMPIGGDRKSPHAANRSL